MDFRIRCCVMGTVVAIAACATAPIERVAEDLDTGTGTTVSRLATPVELLTERPRAAMSDPFAYLAPFETNQMGRRNLYLWVAAPQDRGALARPLLLCDAEELELIPVTGDLRTLGLSGPPYPAPAPWAGQWYFRLPQAALECLAGARRISIVASDAEGQELVFSAEADQADFEPLQEFALRVSGGEGPPRG